MLDFFPHQQQTLSLTETRNRVAYYLDMGLGKTFVGAEKMIRLNEKINLVVCQKSKVDDWVEHFTTYYDVFVINCTIPKNMKMLNDNEFNTNIKYVLVINYDLLFRRNWFLHLTDFTLMLDESSMIQNEKAKRTKFTLNLKPKNVILLSGTPTSGKYENLWSQMQLLGWDISQSAYNKQYVNWKQIKIGGFPRNIVNKADPYKNVERLKTKMREHGAVFMKTEECFDLPEQTFININVKTSKLYQKFKKESVIQIDLDHLIEYKDDSDFYGIDMTPYIELIGDTNLAKRQYLRMLCGQYSADKLQAFKDLVSSTHDRLIVFYNFNGELEQLKKIAKSLDRPVSEVNGHIKNLNAYEYKDNSITFVQYQAGAMGLNLQKANKIIYFTLPLLSEHFEQSKKRIHRIGQKNTCFYYTLISNGSIEEEINQTLDMRRDYTDELFKENGGN